MTRILMIPTPFRYVNPTWDLLINQLSHSGSVEIFGPRNGRECFSIKTLIRENGQFDVIICDPWFFFKESSAPDKFKPRDFEEIGVPVIVSLMQYDLHNLSKQFVDEIKDRAAVAISAGTGNDFFYTPADKDYCNEQWLKRGSYSISSDDALGRQFVLLPHCVAPHELSRCEASEKRSDIIVPGVQYHFRKLVRELFAANDEFTMGTERDLIQRVLGRLSMANPLGNSLRFRNGPSVAGLYQRRFRKAIERSHVAVTCDGSIGYPVRKFFEIPAAGTVLAAKFFDRPERLGFRPGENCYDVTEENLGDLFEIVRLARSDSPSALHVRESGQAMVRDLHSVEVRTRQLLDLCEAVASGAANTMTWHEGRPVLQKTETNA